jgi:hypothetical protein
LLKLVDTCHGLWPSKLRAFFLQVFSEKLLFGQEVDSDADKLKKWMCHQEDVLHVWEEAGGTGSPLGFLADMGTRGCTSMMAKRVRQKVLVSASTFRII